MSKSTIEDKISQLADSVGELIKYWGVKEIHGRIWTHIYLSENPITAKDLTRKLGVTKGLVSTALAELIAYHVIEKVSLGDARSPGYQSNTDLVDVINNILRNRELRLTTKIQHNIKALSEEMDSQNPSTKEKVRQLDEMTTFAVDSLTKLLNHKTISTERFKIIMKLIS